MKNITKRKKFSNTKKNSQLRSFLIIFTIIMIMETVIAIFLVKIITKTETMFIFISGMIIILEVFLFLRYFLPLYTSSNKLKEKHLQIAIGGRFSIKVPWNEIQDLRQAKIKVSTSDSLNIVLSAEDKRFYCMGATTSSFVATLKNPRQIKFKSTTHSKIENAIISEIYFNVDEEQLFLYEVLERFPEVQFIEESGLEEQLNSNKIDMIEESNSGFVLDMGIELSNSLKLSEREKERESKNSVLEINNLCYSYAGFDAVKKLSMNVKEGEIYAFLGANGAGKSTTLKMITGLLKPNKGTILLENIDLWQCGNENIRKKIAFVPDHPILYERLTVKEHLYYCGLLMGLKKPQLTDKIDSLIKLFELGGVQNKMINTYSQGMQRKVSFCVALLADPQLLIVDELTNAFDAKTLALIKDIFRKRKTEGKATVFSGHVLSVAEEISDYITIIKNGHVELEGNKFDIKRNFGNASLESIFLDVTEKEADICKE